MRLARDKIPGVSDRYINIRPAKLRESLLRYSPLRLIKQAQMGESLVETGESRTQRSLPNTAFNNAWYDSCQSTSNTPTPQPNSTQLLQCLLSRLIELGDIARQLSHNIGGNGHCPDEIRARIDQLK